MISSPRSDIHESLKNRFENPFAIANQQSAKVVLGRELIKPVAWRTEIDVRLAPKATRLLRGREMAQRAAATAMCDTT